MKTMIKTLLASVLLALLSFSVDAKQPRSKKAKSVFKYTHPCPANGSRSGSCPGFVIDHIKALDCGGEDAPSNMQWQTVADGKAKNKWERVGCNN